MPNQEPLIIESQLNGVQNCPHCGISSPLLIQKWRSDSPLPRSDGGTSLFWAIYSCTSCSGIVSARGIAGSQHLHHTKIDKIFPDVWKASEIIPERIRIYLTQAHKTLSSPDAPVIMSASSIDAMLKDHGLEQGNLYSRIDKAVEKGIITKKMADWAHRVRLDSNNPRHADSDNPHMSPEEARRAFDYADALTEYLYLLPSRMPPNS